jgi:glyoxylase-like metal-dependent hydrolase (beta-lactamase superfamily II)
MLPGVRVIPMAGHTRGSVMFLISHALFSGDSLCWDFRRHALHAFRDACWYDRSTQFRSLERLVHESFSGVFAGHGGSIILDAPTMQRELRAFLDTVKAD